MHLLVYTGYFATNGSTWECMGDKFQVVFDGRCLSVTRPPG